ncbi:Protein of unknown function [Gryllus bimaculatus]|nr:Protein of unknown function [Gryllus bimaculatus]
MEATRAVVSGRRHVLQFYLRFPPGKPVPSLLALTVNDYDVCRARGAESDALSTISLESALSTGVSGAPQIHSHQSLGLNRTPQDLGQSRLRVLQGLQEVVENHCVGGWGRHEGGALSDTLRIARMPVVSQET